MKIIVLQGWSNQGKTRTLNLVHELLVPDGGGTSTNKQPLGGDPRDFSDIVTRGSQSIAFYTMGDYSNALANAIYNYNDQGCNVMICALSTNTPKIRANNALNQFNAIRINKTIELNEFNQLTINRSDAEIIFRLI